MSKICRKGLFQWSEHGNQKRPTPVLPHRIMRTVPSAEASRDHKYRRHNNPSEGPEFIADPSHQRMIRQFNPPTEESRRGGRPVRSRQTTTVRPCPYYLRSILKELEGIPKEQWDRQSIAEQPQEK
ncbi:hypothetical protein TNCV_2178781 [Trichonephila clavipes]|uniref:Uncharacterized protein n=1 Tax=Trichonephila clavipes TaxID=2585209 RepID=A0A8X6VUE0_TRICX|nr:hypothetical protein TNCV_2178781 [Trichonephila clavipes]